MTGSAGETTRAGMAPTGPPPFQYRRTSVSAYCPAGT